MAERIQKAYRNACEIPRVGKENKQNFRASGHELLLLLSMEDNILDYENWQWIAKGQIKKSTWDSKYRLASYSTRGRILFKEFGPFFISTSFISDVQMQAFIPVATPVKDFPAINCLHPYPKAMAAVARWKPIQLVGWHQVRALTTLPLTCDICHPEIKAQGGSDVRFISLTVGLR